MTISMHGWLVLDKPLGMSSAQAVGKLKYFLKPGKIGHGGTLDPLATGILPIAIGEATKTVNSMMDATKHYRFTVCWGESRATDDAEGEVTATSSHRPGPEAISAVIPGFIGTISQLPPIYSALKVGGKRAYALARAGEDVVLESRNILIHNLKLIECPDSDHAVFEVECGKGTYVRSLARDLAQKLGTLGYVSALRRLKVGKFDETHAISLDNEDSLLHNARLNLLPVESALDDILALEADLALSAKLRHGHAVFFPSVDSGEDEQKAYVMHQNKLVAVGTLAGKCFTPARVFNY